ncbi:hypothetical protein LWC33_29465 [Pseudonocardia sp. RS11V-5]|uniref:DUF6010 family protein n=1 Tax=Pseudonocardia terrae TaxID=2905831 RepID=UPI001E364C47|nr:DUF6010 family protein [Pseudonocardia terrae]MCE3555561.1 hypothetical protein [Pseudonocardia terrae]
MLELLVGGAVGGAFWSLVGLVLARFVRDVVGRVLLAGILIAAAVFYVVFAAREDAGTAWLAGEVLGIVLYGGMAVLGVRGSYWWLVAGWALHPVWDIVLHNIGPGRAFAPEAYTISCLSWDLVVAAAIAVAYGTGLVGDRRGRTRATTAPAG